MRTDDVLSALGAGLWTWDNATGRVTLDAQAAHLLGLADDGLVDDGPGSGGPVREVSGTESNDEGTRTVSPKPTPGDDDAWPYAYPAGTVRSRLHAVDYIGFQGSVTLALSEETTAEILLRVVDQDGAVMRTVRCIVHPRDPEHPETTVRPAPVVGLIYEAPDSGTLRPAPKTPQQEEDEAAAERDWRRNREAFLLDTGRALAEAYTTTEVLRVATSLAMPGFSPDALAVFCLYRNQLTVYGAPHGSAVAGLGGVPTLGSGGARVRLSDDDPAAEVVRTGRPIYLLSPQEYAARFPEARPAEAQPGATAWSFLPLRVAGRTIGVWMAAFARPVPFSPDERAVLTTVARMLAQSLSRAMLNESERELSAGLQRTMRPARKPVIAGMELAARYIPTGGGLQIGGDWYDVIPLPSGRTALVIGDVQGHDVRAAGIMGQLRVAVRAYASEGHRPDAVLARASRFLHGMSGGDPATASAPPSEPADETTAPPVPDLPTALPTAEDDPERSDPRFATCLYIEVDPATGVLDVARAGHPDPAVQMPDGPMLVRPTAGGLPLGVEPDADYPTTRLVLEPGERLLMCTDGLIETGGHDLETGWERVREIVAEHGDADLEELADHLVQIVHERERPEEQHHRPAGPLLDRHEDDIALLLLSPSPSAGPQGPPGTVATAARRTMLTIAQAEPDRIAEARHRLHDLLHDWADPEQVDGAVLMLSEMLTNVLVHTDGDAQLHAQIICPHEAGPEGIEAGPRVLRVRVADTSDELPHRRSPGELASSGRGLMLLGMLADRWGVEPRGEGKLIWFEITETNPEKNEGGDDAVTETGVGAGPGRRGAQGP
ncbi:ATP-binding SpoIIE family protein phosphatase [Streptomyces cacaoi]|uniref:ATP-binding SpoIIE family protein phosphatase n=1 Tax=Streptomyces cacaoi TaxID=1898 RepID=UPI00331C37C0